MKAGFQIEQFRVRHNLPIYVVCHVFYWCCFYLQWHKYGL